MPSRSSPAAWSGRPPAINAKGGLTSRTTASCSARSSGGTKPRMPTPQGRAPSIRAASSNSVPDLLFAQQCQGEKRKPTVVRDRLGKRRDVADAGHRALENRIARAMIDGQGRALGERTSGGGA